MSRQRRTFTPTFKREAASLGKRSVLEYMSTPTGLALQAVFNAASTSLKAFQAEPKG